MLFLSSLLCAKITQTQIWSIQSSIIFFAIDKESKKYLIWFKNQFHDDKTSWKLNEVRMRKCQNEKKEIKMFILFLQLQISDVRPNSILCIMYSHWKWEEDRWFSMKLSFEQNWLDYSATDTSSSNKIEMCFLKDFERRNLPVQKC